MATFNTVATQCKTILEGLSGAPTIVVRKNGTLHPRENPPIIIVSLWSEELDLWSTIGAGSDSTDQGDTGKGYTVAITLYMEVLGDTESNMDTTTDYWLAAKQALNKGGLTGVSSSWNVEIKSGDLFDNQAWKEGHELSQIFVTVGCYELRNG